MRAVASDASARRHGLSKTRILFALSVKDMEDRITKRYCHKHGCHHMLLLFHGPARIRTHASTAAKKRRPCFRKKGVAANGHTFLGNEVEGENKTFSDSKKALNVTDITSGFSNTTYSEGNTTFIAGNTTQVAGNTTSGIDNTMLVTGNATFGFNNTFNNTTQSTGNTTLGFANTTLFPGNNSIIGVDASFSRINTLPSGDITSRRGGNNQHSDETNVVMAAIDRLGVEIARSNHLMAQTIATKNSSANDGGAGNGTKYANGSGNGGNRGKGVIKARGSGDDYSDSGGDSYDDDNGDADDDGNDDEYSSDDDEEEESEDDEGDDGGDEEAEEGGGKKGGPPGIADVLEPVAKMVGFFG